MEDSLRSHSYVCVKVKHMKLIREKLDEIREKFCVRLREAPSKADVSNCAGLGLSVLFFTVEKDDDSSQVEVSETACRVQTYVDDLCGTEPQESDRGDDSSYDSDPDEVQAQAHLNVSRTTSDTLGQEFAEYVSQDVGYTSRLEFGLRLGYTERLVQAALHKLGPNPAQNELLAELIKLGAQCPRPTSDDQDELRPDVAVQEAEDARLRPIVIDGSNVAMSHGNKEMFSCRGIRLCVDWFRARGHKDITVFVPKWRKEASRPDNIVTEQEILNELERERLLVFTPSRLIGGKRLVCYDDRYILRLAADTDGVVVSNDNYRDLAQESPEFRKVVEERILMYSFVNDRFMPPDDPLGRSGPTLDQFLRFQHRRGDPPPACPYARKCTYGNKCKFSHPERGLLPHKSVTERLHEQAQRQLQAAGLPSSGTGLTYHSPNDPSGKLLKGKSLSLPLPLPAEDATKQFRKTPLSRTKSNAPAMVESGSCGGALPPVAAAAPMPTVGRSYSVENVALRSRSLTTPDEVANLHRKVQRQLTLNPNFDPRLQQLRARAGAVSAQAPVAHPEGDWEHASVVRIASAPDSSQTWVPHMTRHGASDPQLNLCAPQRPPILSPAPSLSPTSAMDWTRALWNQHHVEARRRLHYHLASIFPEEQVAAAMQLYPHEIDPQKICAAILAMQPKSLHG